MKMRTFCEQRRLARIFLHNDVKKAWETKDCLPKICNIRRCKLQKRSFTIRWIFVFLAKTFQKMKFYSYLYAKPLCNYNNLFGMAS